MESLISIDSINRMSAEIQVMVSPDIDAIDLTKLWNGATPEQRINLFENYATALANITRKHLKGELND